FSDEVLIENHTRTHPRGIRSPAFASNDTTCHRRVLPSQRRCDRTANVPSGRKRPTLRRRPVKSRSHALFDEQKWSKETAHTPGIAYREYSRTTPATARSMDLPSRTLRF